MTVLLMSHADHSMPRRFVITRSHGSTSNPFQGLNNLGSGLQRRVSLETRTRCIVLLKLPLVHRSSMSPRLTSTVPA